MTTPPPRSPEPSLRTLAARVALLEQRMADIEGPHSETLYQLRRDAVRSRLAQGRILDHLGIEHVTDEEIDAALDEET